MSPIIPVVVFMLALMFGNAEQQTQKEAALDALEASVNVGLALAIENDICNQKLEACVDIKTEDLENYLKEKKNVLFYRLPPDPNYEPPVIRWPYPCDTDIVVSSPNSNHPVKYVHESAVSLLDCSAEKDGGFCKVLAERYCRSKHGYWKFFEMRVPYKSSVKGAEPSLFYMKYAVPSDFTLQEKKGDE